MNPNVVGEDNHPGILFSTANGSSSRSWREEEYPIFHDHSGSQRWGGAHTETTHHPGAARINLDEKLNELNDAIAQVKNRRASIIRGPDTVPRIQKAPPLYRDKESVRKYLEPKVYSFGPIHHGKPELRKGEEIKYKLATIYARTFGLDPRVLLGNVQHDVRRLRQWYDAELVNKYDDDELSWIFFVDGCALLYYIIDAVDYRILGKKRPVNFWPKVMHSDVFRLENQLPYDLLLMLIIIPSDSNHLQANPHQSIDMFIAFYSIFSDVPTVNSEALPVESVAGIKDRIHILDVVWQHTKLANGVPPERRGPHVNYYHVPYTIQELKRVGIRLRPAGASNGPSKVCFNKGWLFGELTLPRIQMSPRVATVLANLMAYEMCPDHPNNFTVTSYVCFLNSLLNNDEDVAEMKSSEILYNYLSSDKAVIELLHELAFDVSRNYGVYLPVKLDITQYLKSYKARTKVIGWFLEAAQVYFRTPWTTIAFFAAALAIALTMTNTISAVRRHHGQACKCS